MASFASLINIGSNLVWRKNTNNDTYTISGNVGIGITNPSYKLDVVGSINASTDIYRNGVKLQNYLFNNNGNGHGNITDFNNVSDFGYNFITNTTNSPAVNSATQYYSWNIGLGSQYPWTAFGCQFALPRNVANPYMCVRYKESSAFGAWNKISAGQADKLTTARTINGVSFDGSANISVNDTRWTSGTGLIYLTTTTNNVGIGITNPQTQLSLTGTISFNTTIGAPSVGAYGANNGTKLVLYPGDAVSYPFALGIEPSTMWYNVPPGSSHKFYSGSTNLITLNSTGLGIGTTSPIYKLDVYDSNFRVGIGYLGGLEYKWNVSSGIGESVFYNLKGEGTGGFQFKNKTTTNVDAGYTNIKCGSLNIYEATGTAAINSISAPTSLNNTGSIVLEHGNSGGASSIYFKSKVNGPSDGAYIQYQDDATIGGIGELSKLIIGVANDGFNLINQDDIILLSSGGVGIGVTNPTSKLDVAGDINLSGTLRQNGVDIGIISNNKYFYPLSTDNSSDFDTDYANYLVSVNNFSKLKGNILGSLSHSNLNMYDKRGNYSIKYNLSGYSYESNFNKIVNVVCSIYHTVCLEETGKVLAFGYNFSGSGRGLLGDGTTTSRLFPVYVISTTGVAGTFLTNIVNIVCSDNHTVFLENTGKVLACGYNNGTNGIIGDNTSTIRLYPVYVVTTSGTGQLTNIVNIVCTINHTIFLESTGKVLACGYGNGNLGDGTTTTRLSPVYVVSTTGGAGTFITNIVKIVCSVNITVYLENTGKVLACGSLVGYGGVGDNTSTARYFPVYVVSTSGTGQLTNIVNIACGTAHVVYLENTGKVLANGYNNLAIGTLGDGTALARLCPVYVVSTTGVAGTFLTNIVKIVCGNNHTVFLENTGKVLACGNNNAQSANGTGILGDGGTVPKPYPVYVISTTGVAGTFLTNIVNIICSNYHTVYLESTGKVLDCGNNGGAIGTSSLGVLGSGIGVKYYPAYILTYGNIAGIYLTNIVNFACGDCHTVYFENTGKILASGVNSTSVGILGDNTNVLRNNSVYVTSILSTAVITKSNYQYITNKNNITLLNNINTLEYTYNGQVITSNIPFTTNFPINITYPYIKDNTGLANLTGISKIETGYRHIIFLKSTGTVFGVGNNYYGQLGTNASINLYYLPVQMNGATSISDIACGLYHTIILTSTNTVLATGYNNYGQLGTGNTTNYNTATAMLNNTNTNQIACGEYHTLLKKTTNIVYTCGLNSYGQLGINNTTQQATPQQLKDVAGTGFLANISTIKAGPNHSVFLSSTGVVYGCGRNNYGQIGAPLTTTYSMLPVLSTTIYYNISTDIYSQSISSTVSDIYTNLRTDGTFILI